MLSAIIWPGLVPLPLLLFSIPAVVLLRRYPLLLGWILGVTLFHLQAHRLVHPERPLHSGDVTLVARVASLPVGDEIYQRSQWQVEAINGETFSLWWPDRVTLGWYGAPALALGQRYQLQVRLKPPSGILNQGGGNARQRALAEGISATGYIRNGLILEDSRHWRGVLAKRLASQVSALPRGDLLRALVLGDRRGIGNDRWQALRSSGLVHLVAISGLHLSIVAGWVLWLGRKGLSRFRPSATGQGQGVLWLICGALVLGYAALAGYALPTRRAAVMVLLALALLWRCHEARPWELALRAAALVLLLQPLAALSAGFWLSFGAVVTLLMLNWCRPPPEGRWAKLGYLLYLQLGLALVMTLIQGAWFQTYTLQGIWANALALPLFSLLVLPLCLLAGMMAFFVPEWAATPLWLADQALALVTVLSEWALWAEQRWPLLGGHLSSEAAVSLLVMLLALGMGLLRPWRLWPVYLMVLLLVVGWRLWRPEPPWQLHLIDVGQGLAVVVEQEGHFLLYDTGAAFVSGYRYAERAVLPMLRERGAERLDYLAVSHSDNDHAGGVPAIRDALPVLAHRGLGGACQGEEQWHRLTLRWWRAPAGPAEARAIDNNDSCTLRISDGVHSVLLPGDIEADAEALMVEAGVAGPVSVLVSPHHGSATSSSPGWLAALSPQWVLVPAGYRNRWGFPHPAVLARYRAIDSQVWVVGQEGQITVGFWPGQPARLISQRRHRSPWWYNRQQDAK
nr:DNA internalization-related competence protein ComEC/Rec2 [Ferrimonas balearica]